MVEEIRPNYLEARCRLFCGFSVESCSSSPLGANTIWRKDPVYNQFKVCSDWVKFIRDEQNFCSTRKVDIFTG